jgi:MFS family permease
MVTLVTLIAFEAMAVSTAMPVAARALGGLREYGLAFSLFFTTSLAGIAAAGAWNDARGPRQPLVTGLTLFSGGLLLSGSAHSFDLMLVGRAVSGLGAGLQIVTLYVVVATVFPQSLQPRAFGVISAAWVLPSVLGPPVAGVLATTVGWRVVFLAVPPLALAPLAALWPRLARSGPAPGSPSSEEDRRPDERQPSSEGDTPEPSQGRARADRLTPAAGLVADVPPRRLVVHGVVLTAGALLLQWGLQGGGALPAVPVVLAGLVLAAAGAPGLLPRGLLRLRRGLPGVVVCRGLFTGTFFGAETFVPLMLVEQRGLSPALAGLALTTGALGWSVGSNVQGRGLLPLTRAGLLGVGGVVVAVSILGIVPTPSPAVPVWVVPALWTVGGIGMGLAMSSTSVLTLRLSVPGEEGRNSAALQIGDVLGSVLGVGVAGAVFAALHGRGDDPRAFTVIWLALGLAALLAWPASRRVPDAARKTLAQQGSGPAL